MHGDNAKAVIMPEDGESFNSPIVEQSNSTILLNKGRREQDEENEEHEELDGLHMLRSIVLDAAPFWIPLWYVDVVRRTKTTLLERWWLQ